MGNTGKISARIAAVLVVVASALSAAIATTPAHAAGGLPDRCVESQSGSTVRFYSNAPIVDLDVRIWMGYQEIRSDIYLVNGPDQYGPRWLLTDQFNRLGPVGGVTFDNQAPYGYDDSPPSSGEVRVRPKQELPIYWSGDPTFSVFSGGPVPSRDITVTVTWADCDEDRDSWGDKTRDNCVGLYNPDQRDLDRDGAGDACDPDDDNDGVADASDNCPTTANPDQTDWDGDRVGNACDSTPGTAPAPPPAPVTPTPPGTGTPPVGCSVGCAYASTLGLRHRAARHRFTGTVDSVAVGCRSGVDVTIWRKQSGDDRKLVVVTTRTTGAFRTKAPRKAGRYYATVGSAAQPLCGGATSRVVRIKRR